MGVLNDEPDTDYDKTNFEWKLLLILLSRSCRDKPHFNSRREEDGNEKVFRFVFEYEENVYRLLQVIHTVSPEKGIHEKLSFSKGDLIKCFISYLNVKNDFSKSGKIKDFIICTNLSKIHFQKEMKFDFERIAEKDSVFDIECTGIKSERYRVKNPTEYVDQIKDEWKEYMKKWQHSSRPKPSTEDIENFLKNLIFVLNVPNENDLDVILENELGEEFTEMVNETIYDRAFRCIVDWVEDKNYHDFRTDKDVEDLFDQLKRSFILSNDSRFVQPPVRYNVQPPVRYNVQPPVNLFTGRKEHFERIHKFLQEKKPVVICGIGGVGKTELARKYIGLYGEKHENNILWINAESDDATIKCFRGLASNKLKIKTIDENSEKKEITFVIEEVFDRFRNSKSLFILDNAEWSQYENYIKPALSKTGYQPYIIITSRNKWENENTVNHIDLNVFTESEATDFISKSLPEFLRNNQQDDNVKKLGEALQYLPLALQQACAYINTEFEYEAETYQISEYIENLQVNCQEYLNYSLSDYCESGYAKTVWTTWDATIEALQQKENYTLKILNCMSFLLPGDIHASLLYKLFEEEQKLQKSIELLKKYSLITDRDNVYCLNRLVQLVIREKLQPTEKQEVLERISKGIVKKDETITRSIDHLAFAWMHLKEIFNSARQLAENYCHVPAVIALILFDINRYKEAYALGVETLKLINLLSLENEQEQQRVQNIAPIIVKFICNIGEQNEALNKAKTILEISKDMNKPLANTSPIFSIETNIISLCLKMTDVHSAIEFFNESFLINMVDAEEHNLAIVFRMEILGDIFVELSEYDSALRVYRSIFDRQKNNARTSEPSILRISKKIAIALSEVHINKQMKGTRTYFAMIELSHIANEVLSILRNTYGNQKKIIPNNENDMLETQECIINVLIGNGKYGEALDLLKNISDERLKRNNFNMLAKKASVLAFLGKSYDALATCEDLKNYILTLERGNFKEVYPSIVHSRVKLALVTSLLGKVDEALIILEEIWNDLKYSIGFYNLYIINTLDIIRDLYLRRDEIDQFFSVFVESIQCSKLIKVPNLDNFRIYSFALQVQFSPENFFTSIKESVTCSKCIKVPNLSYFKIYSSAMQPQFSQEKVQADSTLQLTPSYNFDNLKMQKEFIPRRDNETYYRQYTQMLIKMKSDEKKFLGNDFLNKGVNFSYEKNSPYKHKAWCKAIRLSKTKNPFVAVASGNLAQLIKLFKNGVDVNTEDKNKRTLLHYAASSDEPTTVEYLLQNGADATRCTRFRDDGSMLFNESIQSLEPVNGMKVVTIPKGLVVFSGSAAGYTPCNSCGTVQVDVLTSAEESSCTCMCGGNRAIEVKGGRFDFGCKIFDIESEMKVRVVGENWIEVEYV